MKPLLWMRLIRDLDEFTVSRLAVLWALALRMDMTGAGFASAKQLAGDAKVSAETVWRATKQARGIGYLVQSRRGHRVSAELVLASEWQLTQSVTGDTLAEPNLSGVQSQSVREATQSVTGDYPRGPLQEVSHPEPSNVAAVTRGPGDEWMDLDNEQNNGHRQCPRCSAPWPRDVTPPPHGFCRRCLIDAEDAELERAGNERTAMTTYAAKEGTKP